jgi:hypothetical protein
VALRAAIDASDPRFAGGAQQDSLDWCLALISRLHDATATHAERPLAKGAAKQAEVRVIAVPTGADGRWLDVFVDSVADEV